jgi:protein-S-isoprenylcysteine O-methyltransferase Ste14
MLSKQMAQSGSWLFKWRSYLPLAVVAVIVPGLLNFSYPLNSHSWDLAYEMVCLFISMFGLAIRCYTIGYVPAGTSGRNTKSQIADTLNTTGIYSIVRNPLYLGNFFMMLGVVSFVRLWWADLVFCLLFCVYYERIIIAEETFLESKFGVEYLEYARRTPAFFPRFKCWVKPNLPFSFRNVLKREYSGLFAVILLMFLLEVVEDYVVEGELEFDPVWVTLLAASAVIYVTLRTLKRRTRLLRVEGR